VSRKTAYDDDGYYGDAKKQGVWRNGGNSHRPAQDQHESNSPLSPGDHPLASVLYFILVASSVGWLIILFASADQYGGEAIIPVLAAAVMNALCILAVIAVLNMLHRMLKLMEWFATCIPVADQKLSRLVEHGVDAGMSLDGLKTGIEELNTGISECCHELRQLKSKQSTR
jgi:hypothetical protein